MFYNYFNDIINLHNHSQLNQAIATSIKNPISDHHVLHTVVEKIWNVTIQAKSHIAGIILNFLLE